MTLKNDPLGAARRVCSARMRPSASAAGCSSARRSHLVERAGFDQVDATLKAVWRISKSKRRSSFWHGGGMTLMVELRGEWKSDGSPVLPEADTTHGTWVDCWVLTPQLRLTRPSSQMELNLISSSSKTTSSACSWFYLIKIRRILRDSRVFKVRSCSASRCVSVSMGRLRETQSRHELGCQAKLFYFDPALWRLQGALRCVRFARRRCRNLSEMAAAAAMATGRVPCTRPGV